MRGRRCGAASPQAKQAASRAPGWARPMHARCPSPRRQCIQRQLGAASPEEPSTHVFGVVRRRKEDGAAVGLALGVEDADQRHRERHAQAHGRHDPRDLFTQIIQHALAHGASTAAAQAGRGGPRQRRVAVVAAAGLNNQPPLAEGGQVHDGAIQPARSHCAQLQTPLGSPEGGGKS